MTVGLIKVANPGFFPLHLCTATTCLPLCRFPIFGRNQLGLIEDRADGKKGNQSSFTLSHPVFPSKKKKPLLAADSFNQLAPFQGLFGFFFSSLSKKESEETEPHFIFTEKSRWSSSLFSAGTRTQHIRWGRHKIRCWKKREYFFLHIIFFALESQVFLSGHKKANLRTVPAI